MNDETSPEAVYRWVRLALPLMSKHNVAATPHNYTVWYHYVSGSNSALNKAIDAMRDKGEIFSEEKNVALYARFFTEKDEKELRQIREDLQ
jgi:diguanylate cyclase